ncbi:MAG: type IV secretory system conjugative DNA transfer family protein [Candidatus Thiodiazotropha lotti]|nr:type IV secretory system conjugative DNA transfer family protein [Candidatus Thiodiazotropha lotti]
MQTREQYEAAHLYSRDPHLHGSARWADRAHLKARHYGEQGRIFLGYGLPEHTKASSYPITSNTQRHLLTIAPTRSGKLLTASAPRCMEHTGSLVVLDVKDGELALITARYRRDVLGHKVIIVDPWDQVCSSLGFTPARFNVLDGLDPDGDDFVEDAMQIADSLVTDRGVKEPFWNDEAKAMIVGLIMYVAATPTVLLPTEKKSRDLTQVRRLLNLSGRAFKAMVEGRFEEDEDGNAKLVQPGMAQSSNDYVRDAAGRILNKAGKELSGVISTAQQNTHFLEASRIQRSLSASDFSFSDLENGKTDIYIVLPAGRVHIYHRFLRLLIGTALIAATRFHTKPNPPVYFLIEEAVTALGKMEIIETAFGLMAGFGLQLHLIVQDLNQLFIYEQSWQTFIANSGVIQVFGTNDLMSIEYISRLCGVGTVESLSEESAARRAALFSDPNFLSRDDGVNARSLITPDEVRTMHPSAQLLILSHAHPVACFKTAYFLDARYRDKSGKPLFDIHPHYAHKKLPALVNFLRPGLDIGGVLEPVFTEGA